MIRIGKCAVCKATSRKDYTEFREVVVGHGMYGRKARQYGRAIANNGFIRASADFECPRCGEHRWNAKKVEGFTTETKCDARCQQARGHMCECACGGENHGKGFICN